MKRTVLSIALATVLVGATAAPAAAQIEQRGGAAGLVAVVAQVALSHVDVEIANNSLNNLLRNADIDVLNNILNRSVNNNTILSNIDITIFDVLQDNTVIVNVLSSGVSIGQITVTP
jgi:hypothetical protein